MLGTIVVHITWRQVIKSYSTVIEVVKISAKDRDTNSNYIESI